LSLAELADGSRNHAEDLGYLRRVKACAVLAFSHSRSSAALRRRRLRPAVVVVQRFYDLVEEGREVTLGRVVRHLLLA
jgi:hypothetical protein